MHMYRSVSKSAVVAAAILAVLAGTILMSSDVVEARGAKTRVVSPRECAGSSDKRYYNNLRHLLDYLVDETKNVYRPEPGMDYVYSHSYPNVDMDGSVSGVATCNSELGWFDCWTCLKTTKDNIKSHCKRAVSGSLKLQDCSITFKSVAV